MSDYLTLCRTLQREVGVTGAPMAGVTGQSSIYEKLANWIADADVFIQSLHWDWNFLWKQHQVNTVVDDDTPTGPADLGVWDRGSFFLDFTTQNWKKLTEMSYIDYRNSVRQGVKTSRKPNYIIIRPDKTLRFDVPANAIYSFTGDYWKTPTKMTANADTSDIPEQFRRIIVVQAKLWYAEEEEVPAVFEVASGELRTLLAELESHELPDQERRRKSSGDDLTVVPV